MISRSSSRPLTLLAATTAISLMPLSGALLFSDNFDVNTGIDINAATGTPRQSGSVGPLEYLSNFVGASQASDYHQQLPNGAVLLLAGDAGLVSTLVSPAHNFIGADRVTVDIDTGVNSNLAPGIFTATSITIGAAALSSESSGAGFSVKLVQDTFGGNGEFLQVFLPGSGGSPSANLVPLPGGFNTVGLSITGLGDGNAYDGSGDAMVGVTVNGETLDLLAAGTPSSFTVPGGFTENFVTLGGTWAAGTAGLDTHLFDNLSIEGTPIPEPSSAVLATLPFLAFLLRRRTR